MSFLNELKRQAAAIQPQAQDDVHVLERNTRLSHGACRIARDYWKELADHLNVLRPTSAARYLLDGRRTLDAVRCGNFRVVANSRRSHEGEEFFEAVVFAWQAGNGERMRIEKDFPTEADRVRASLRQAGIQYHESSLRDEAGRSSATDFEFTADVTASIRLVPLAESGRVRAVFSNIDQLERVEADFPAAAMRPRRLDEIARWIVGQPNRVLEYAGGVKRFQA